MILISRIVFLIGCFFVLAAFFLLVLKHGGVALRFLNYSFFVFIVGLVFYIISLLGKRMDGKNKEK